MTTKPTPQAPQGGELVFIGEVALDGEAELISSLFTAHDLPLVIQGRQHRRMLGFLGGGYIHMRLLVPQEHEARSRELLNLYYEQRGEELAQREADEGSDESADEGADEGYVPRRRWFTHNSRHIGVALLLSAFFGFGTSCLYAGAVHLALLFGGLQLALYASPEQASAVYELLGSLASGVGVTYDELKVFLKIFLPLFDFWVAVFWMLTRGRWGERP